jgi:hypothetical protein
VDGGGECKVGVVPSVQGLLAVSEFALVLASWQAKAQPPVICFVVRFCIWVMPVCVDGSAIDGELSSRT